MSAIIMVVVINITVLTSFSLELFVCVIRDDDPFLYKMQCSQHIHSLV